MKSLFIGAVLSLLVCGAVNASNTPNYYYFKNTSQYDFTPSAFYLPHLGAGRTTVLLTTAPANGDKIGALVVPSPDISVCLFLSSSNPVIPTMKMTIPMVQDTGYVPNPLQPSCSKSARPVVCCSVARPASSPGY